MNARSQSDKAASQRALRPRDAASLLLVDRDGPVTRILMGRRHRSLAFMPGKYVFPGGMTDPLDGQIAAANELNTNDVGKLLAGMGARATHRRARALGLTAIRETFEETGLRVARPTTQNIILPDNDDWCSFLREGLHEGLLPALGDLRYFARAITPPGHVRRFDARFFIVFRDQVPGLDKQTLLPSGELEDLDWVAMDQANKLDVATITQSILWEAKKLLNGSSLALPASLPVVEFSMRHRRCVREVI